MVVTDLSMPGILADIERIAGVPAALAIAERFVVAGLEGCFGSIYPIAIRWCRPWDGRQRGTSRMSSAANGSKYPRAMAIGGMCATSACGESVLRAPREPSWLRAITSPSDRSRTSSGRAIRPVRKRALTGKLQEMMK